MIIEVLVFDGLWNYDVYLMVMVLMWLYFVGKKDNYIEEVFWFLEFVSFKNIMVFDGSVYVLILLSFYSGEWENE